MHRARFPMFTRRMAGLLLWMASLVALFGAQSQAMTAVSKAEPARLKPVSRHTDFSEWITSVAFSPDGKLIAAGSYDEFALLAPSSDTPAKKLKTKTGFAKAITFSPDGKLLAVGGYQSLQLWNVDTLERVGAFEGHGGYVTGLSFSPDGQTLASSSEDEMIRLWDVAGGMTTRTITGHSFPVMDVAFSPDGTMLASAAGDATRVTKPGEVKVWDVATGKERVSLVGHEKVALCVAFSPDGKTLVSGSQDEKVNVYDLSAGKASGFFGGHSRPTNSVVFSPDGRVVISGSGGRAQGKNEIKVWNPADGEELAGAEGHKRRVSCLAVSPDGTRLASGSHDKTLVLWDLSPFVASAAQPAQPIAALKPSSTLLAAADTTETSNKTADARAGGQLRAGIIGLDTSHVLAFTKTLNDENAPADVANCRVVAAYPKGSPDIESSVTRVPKYTEQIEAMGVEIVESIDELLKKVDVVFLETNDGRPHLEQVLKVFKAGKPVFIDKPVAGTLADAVAIYSAGKHYGVPVFSSSSLRYSEGAQAVRNGSVGKVQSCETYSPCHLEKTHPDLFWYGIHGVENLFTVMGTGCQTVARSESTPEHDFVEATWDGGRTGIFRGYRKGGKSGYGATAVGEKGEADAGGYKGYRPLVVDIVKFFRTGKPPVSAEETIEIYAFMEAADRSKRLGGAEVALKSVLATAEVAAANRLAELDDEFAAPADNQLTTAEKSDGWQLLFNGKDYTGWKCNNDKPIASKIENASLVPYESGGYLIIHEQQFGDFIFQCDVKMGEQCNSGVFFRVGTPTDPVQTGIEAQVQTGSGAGYHDFGALYDLAKTSHNNVRTGDAWNTFTLTCKGPLITVAVNGVAITHANCDEFTEPGARPDGSKHKFKMALKDFPRKGYLGFQDHGHKVWFKNVKIKPL